MILLLRHGQTAWNVERRVQGRRESQLTPLGERQARAMAALTAELVAREAGGPAWRLIASPLGRARRTAQAVADRTGLPMELDDRLMEMAFGDWEGLTRDEIGGLRPDLVGTREWFFGAPGGETFEDVSARVGDFMADLPPEPQRRVILVSHGVTGRFVRGLYAALSRQVMLDQDVPQEAVFRLLDGQIDRFDCEPLENA